MLVACHVKYMKLLVLSVWQNCAEGIYLDLSITDYYVEIQDLLVSKQYYCFLTCD